MTEIQILILSSLFTISFTALWRFLENRIRQNDIKKMADQADERDKERELEREQRALDRELQFQIEHQKVEIEREQRDLDREQDRYLKQLERNLHDDRMSVYFEVLQPFMVALSSKNVVSSKKEHKGKTNLDIAQQIMSDIDYHKSRFRLTVIGSDAVVLAFTNLMQHFYKTENKKKEIGLEGLASNGNASRIASAIKQKNENSRQATAKMMKLLGDLLIEIRKSVGNEATELAISEMLGWLITDIESYMEEIRTIDL